MSNSDKSHSSKNLWKLAIGALGVVYGDIGTSPLYAMKECFNPTHGLDLTEANIFGVVSLVFWSLTLVVSFKYLFFILRADQHGEGGITALLALLLPSFEEGKDTFGKIFIVTIGLFGAGLLYGEGIITPAISVLSAVEGLEVAIPELEYVVVPVTVTILVALFLMQKRGTGRIGAVFGPIMIIWFFTLAAIGLPWIFRHPEILYAVNPSYAVRFFSEHGIGAFLLLNSVVLCVTGSEALYADMGHFGRGPIRFGWFVLVFPALLINYFGQAALVLDRGQAAVENPFYSLASGWALYPLIVIATIATVIASQALISGAFSLTQQAVQLGFFPRTRIRHTSETTEGQIYVPAINWFLMVACIALVFWFGHSTSLAAAYGIAVTGTMTISSILFFNVARRIWGWNFFIAVPLLLLFLTVDVSFFTANLTKVIYGGWIPILIGFAFLAVMKTWKKGRVTLSEKMNEMAIPLDDFIASVEAAHPPRVKGTGVFMAINRDIAPSVLLHHFKHNQVLHEKVILLTILTEHVPVVPVNNKVRVTDLRLGFIKVIARYGYMESPDVNGVLILCQSSGLRADIDHVSFYLGRESFVASGLSAMSYWEKRLFIILSRNARSATDYFNLPADQVIEIGTQIRI